MGGRHASEHRSLDDDVVVAGDDAALLRDRASGGHVVTRDHAHDDAGVVAVSDGLANVTTQRVLDADDTVEGQVL